MSHFSTIKSQIKDKDCLIAALRAMGIEPEISSVPIQLKSRWKGNATYANIIVRAEQLGIGADIGFTLNVIDNVYEIIADNYELNCGLNRDGSKIPFRQRLAEEYAVAVAVKMGYQVLNRTEVNGRLQVRLAPKQQIKTRR